MSNIYERRSIRKYTDQAVGRTVIEEMIRAGAAAPSAKNRQPWKYLVYEGAAKEEFCNRMQKGLEREQTGKAVLPEAAFGIPDAIHTLAIMREAPVLIVVINTMAVLHMNRLIQTAGYLRSATVCQSGHRLRICCFGLLIWDLVLYGSQIPALHIRSLLII